GSIAIVELDGRIGLVQNFRMTGPRILPEAGSDYVSRLNDEKRWDELLSSLGEWKWEAPRGLIPGPQGKDLEAFIIKTAKLEALQEAGFVIDEARIAGTLNANSTFFAHAQYVVHGKIKSVEKSSPEETEMIGTTKLFTRQELRELQEKGEFDDGLTLAALALCGISI
ncbi:MAG: hypothetical protein G01um101456_562, partial [Parcubacteria group bacterium Gr01-1014_56]